MIKLQETEINKLAALAEITPMQFLHLMTMGLIEEQRAIDHLILHDFRRIKRRRQYRVNQIIEAVKEKYKVPRSRVERVIYAKKVKRYYCDKCSKEISKKEFNRGKGKCDSCAASEIPI